jgi:putative membrane protein
MAMPPIDDGQIAEIVDVVDAQQVPMARLGVDRSSDRDVRTFAEKLLADRTKAKAVLLSQVRRDKIGLQGSILGEHFEPQARDARAWLSNESGVSFDRDFLITEVKEQKIQLDLFDHVLIPAAHDVGLLAELRRWREVAAGRMAEAERLALRFPAAS